MRQIFAQFFGELGAHILRRRYGERGYEHGAQAVSFFEQAHDAAEHDGSLAAARARGHEQIAAVEAALAKL